jgi:hypothetical protein
MSDEGELTMSQTTTLEGEQKFPQGVKASG